MVAEFFLLFALVAAVSAYDHSAFSYGVADPYTSDYKSQIQSDTGDNVKGLYSLLDSDGTQRIVDDAADAGGFNAVVRKDPVFIAGAPAVYGYNYPYAYNFGRFGAYGYGAPYAFRRFY